MNGLEQVLLKTFVKRAQVACSAAKPRMPRHLLPLLSWLRHNGTYLDACNRRGKRDADHWTVHRIMEARREKIRRRELSSDGAQLYYGSKVSLCSTHGMWLTVRDKTAYLSPEELPGSALTILNLKDPYSAGPVRYTDMILLQATDDLLLGTRLRVDRNRNRASYELECVGERGATHVGRWGLLHPDFLHGTVENLKCMHNDKVLLEQDWGLLCVDQNGVSMKVCLGVALRRVLGPISSAGWLHRKSCSQKLDKPLSFPKMEAVFGQSTSAQAPC